MNDNRMTAFNHGLIWFGAAISIAEILTGTLLTPLGFQKALAAIVLGHLIGGLLMYLTGLIGKAFVTGESVKAKRAGKVAAKKAAQTSSQSSSPDIHAFVVSAAIAAVLPELQAENSELVAVLAAACAVSIEEDHRIISYKEVGDMAYARQGRWQLYASKNYIPKRVK